MQREAGPASTLHLWLLGFWRAQLDGGPALRLATRHARLLLARLAVAHPRPLARATLIQDLFPDCPPEVAARRLRATRHYLRQAVGDLLVADEHGLGLSPGLRVACDYLEFLRLSEPGATRADLEAATRIYQGALLESHAEGWAAAEAHAAHTRYVAALRRLIALVRAVDSAAASCDPARRWVAAEPWSEQAHTAYLEALIAAGRRGAALAQLANARALLRAEWSIRPDGALERLARAIGRMPADERLEPPVALPPAAHSPRDVAAALAAPHQLALVGRRAEYAALQELWRNARAGRPRGLLLVGPPGAGKTRLAEELARQALLRAHHTVLWCAADDARPDWVAMVARAVDRLGAEGSHALDRLRAELGVTVTTADSAELPGPAGEASWRVAAVCRLLDQLAARGILLLVIDGLDHAEPELRGALARLLRERHRVVVLITARPGPAEALATPTSEGAALLDRAELGPLAAAEAEALLGTVLGPGLAPALRGRLAEIDALPGRLLGALQGLLHEGALRHDPEAGWRLVPADLPLPMAGDDLLAARIAALPAEARDLAELLAVLGRPADYRLLCALDPDEDRRLDAQAELLAVGLLVERGDGLQFAATWPHGGLRRNLPATRLAALHARVAAALAACPDAGRLERATHSAGAGAWATALELALAAGTEACAEGRLASLAEAIDLAEQALATLAAPALSEPCWQVARLRERLCAARREGQPWADALTDLSALAETAGRAAWRCEALWRCGLAQLAAGAPAEGRNLLGAAATLAREHQLGELEVWCRLDLADALEAGEEHASALDEIMGAARASCPVDTPDLHLHVLLRLGYAYARDGQVETAVALLGGIEAHPLLSRRPLLAARHAHHLGLALVGSGAYERGLAALRDCLQYADAAGDRAWRLHAQAALLTALVGFGLHADALALGESLPPLARRVEELPAHLELTASLAAAHYGQGAADQALELARAGAEQAALHGRAGELAAHCCLGARAALETGRAEEARHLLARVEPLLGPNAPIEQLAAAALVALALGQSRRARTYALLAVAQAARPSLGAPARCGALWDAAEVLATLDGPAVAAPVVERAAAALLDDLGRLATPELRRAFVAATPSRAALTEAAVRAAPRRLVWLPLREAPTGRPLHADELVPVVWTLHHPGDQTEARARRQNQIQRLIAEALEQGAVTTVEMLADVLAVTDRTIKRDLSALRQHGTTVLTRGGLLGTGHRASRAGLAGEECPFGFVETRPRRTSSPVQ